jgi:hypothetical protein
MHPNKIVDVHQNNHEGGMVITKTFRRPNKPGIALKTTTAYTEPFRTSTKVPGKLNNCRKVVAWLSRFRRN